MAGIATNASSVYPLRFEGSFAAFKERQLVFQLARQLAEAQFAHGDRVRSERLWQEAAAEEMDPERITALLYGVDDLSDSEAMEEVDRPFRERARRELLRARSPFRRLVNLSRRRPGASRHSARRAGLRAHQGVR